MCIHSWLFSGVFSPFLRIYGFLYTYSNNNHRKISEKRENIFSIILSSAPSAVQKRSIRRLTVRSREEEGREKKKLRRQYYRKYFFSFYGSFPMVLCIWIYSKPDILQKRTKTPLNSCAASAIADHQESINVHIFRIKQVQNSHIMILFSNVFRHHSMHFIVICLHFGAVPIQAN